MTRKQLLTVAAVAVCLSLVAPVVAGPATADTGDAWPGDRGDPGRTGATAGTAPTGPNATVGQTYSAPSDSEGAEGEPTAPAVVDGTAYVGYDDTGGSVSYGSRGRVVAFDAETGTVEWHRTQLPKVRQTPTVTEDRLYVSGRGPYDSGMGGVTEDPRGGVFALDRATGAVAWARNDSGFDRVTGHLVADGRVYVQQPRSLTALDAATGETLWRRSGAVDGLAWENDTLVTVAEGEAGPTVRAVDPATGDRRWTTTTTTEETYVEPAGLAVANGTVYLSDGERGVSALALSDGRVAWTADLTSRAAGVPAESASPPAVADGTVYVSSTDDAVGTVHALDAATGATRWRFERAAADLFAPTVADDTVYVGAQQEAAAGQLRAEGVWALAAEDGAPRWSFARREYIDRARVTTAAADGSLYVAVEDRPVFFNDGALYALAATDDPVSADHRFEADEPVSYAPTLSVETDPSGAEDAQLDPGTEVTLTANASDPDGNVTAVEWDLDQDGEYERTGETVTQQLDYCGSLRVSVRVTDEGGETDVASVELSTT